MALALHSRQLSGAKSLSRLSEYLAVRDPDSCSPCGARRDGDRRRRAATSAPRRSGTAGKSALTPTAQKRRFPLVAFEALNSPKLANIADDVKLRAAPLLPEPAENPGERFCTEMPQSDLLGGQARQMSGLVSSDLSLAELVARFDNGMTQAAVLLTDRIASAQRKCRDTALTSVEILEISDVADGIAAASYHVKKWAFYLQLPGHNIKPTKPTPCEDVEEALAVMRSNSSWLLVSASAVSKKLAAVLKERAPLLKNT